MTHENQIRLIVRSILQEAAHFDKTLLGDVDGVKSLVFGQHAQKFLKSKGMSDEEYKIVSDRLNDMHVDHFEKYDADFKTYGRKFGIKPSTLKAMAIEETSLGTHLVTSSAGGSAAGIIQITKPTLDTLNANIPGNIHYSYESLVSNPAKSIEIAAHYISHFLIGKRGLKSRSEMLSAYKTGPDSANYVKRVNAFKKLVDIIGI
jgi:hypothetical protein